MLCAGRTHWRICYPVHLSQSGWRRLCEQKLVDPSRTVRRVRRLSRARRGGLAILEGRPRATDRVRASCASGPRRTSLPRRRRPARADRRASAPHLRGKHRRLWLANGAAMLKTVVNCSSVRASSFEGMREPPLRAGHRPRMLALSCVVRIGPRAGGPRAGLFFCGSSATSPRWSPGIVGQPVVPQIGDRPFQRREAVTRSASISR